jgi:hypothetical protein
VLGVRCQILATNPKSKIQNPKSNEERRMSQRDNFAAGFFVGAIFGSIAGGIVATTLASRRDSSIGGENRLRNGKAINLDSEEGMEMARRALEDRIAQLNLAIDDVRHQLGEVGEANERNRERESS